MILAHGASRVSLVAQMVKNLPTVQETWVQSLVWEDPLEKKMATHSSILAWRIPWTVWQALVHRVRKIQTRMSDCHMALESVSITTNKDSGDDEIPAELFQILKDVAVKVLHSIYVSKFVKVSSGHRTGKGLFSF